MTGRDDEKTQIIVLIRYLDQRRRHAANRFRILLSIYYIAIMGLFGKGKSDGKRAFAVVACEL